MWRSDEKIHFVYLRIINGSTQGTHRVSSAVIKLNGNEVLNPAELNQQVSEINRQIGVVSGENLLEVRLRSIPGSFITIEIYRLSGNTCRAFGPQTFFRATGKPVTENVTFPLNPQMTGPFTLNLTNGDTNGDKRVDSATVTLNGQTVFSPSQLSEQVSGLSQDVFPQAVNNLGVELNGAPGDLLTLEMTGFDNTLPQATITSPSNGTIFTSSTVSVSGITDDPSATVTVNGIAAFVAPDGTFTVSGITLEEGENTLTVIATDSCENQYQGSIHVYLQTVSPGPEVLLCIEPFREQIPDPPLPGEECMQEGYGRYNGTIAGFVDETTVSVTLNGILFQEGIGIGETGPFWDGMWEGTFVWAFVKIPQVEGVHPFTLIATNGEGNQSSAVVTFIRDTVPPNIVITTPPYGAIFNTPTVTIRGTVDDPEATVRLGWSGAIIPVTNGTFEIDVTLKEGINNIVITATDPAWNSTYVYHRIILDTTPPVLNITSPTEGMITGSGSMSVSGTITDQNIDTVTVSVNNSAPQNLTITGTTFSGTVTLSAGQNTLFFEARDKAGNVGNATRNVFLDQLQPLVSITSPVSGTQVSVITTVTVEANDIESGISSVSLFVDAQLYGTDSWFPFTFEVDTIGVTAGMHTITARAVDGAGNQAETSVNIDILPQIQVQIVSPADGAAVNKSPVLVKGRVINNITEVGVVVNNVIAQVNGEEFVAEVYLQDGLNTITATATDGAGLEVAVSINVTYIPEASPLTITAIPSSGIQPLEVTLEVETYLTNPVTTYQWDIDGNGTIDTSGPTLSTITNTYPNPGLYFPKVIVTDSPGNRYEATTIVNVLSATELDALLKAKWEGMKQSLLNGDIETTLTYFVAENRDRYRQAFTDMGASINAIFSSVGEFKVYAVYGTIAECGAIRVENGVPYSYPVTFVQDENGIWKIMGF